MGQQNAMCPGACQEAESIAWKLFGSWAKSFGGTNRIQYLLALEWDSPSTPSCNRKYVHHTIATLLLHGAIVVQARSLFRETRFQKIKRKTRMFSIV
jgi:hypothetical protein